MTTITFISILSTTLSDITSVSNRTVGFRAAATTLWSQYFNVSQNIIVIRFWSLSIIPWTNLKKTKKKNPKSVYAVDIYRQKKNPPIDPMSHQQNVFD